MRVALLGVAAALWLAPSAHAAAARTRLLFTSNRSGPTQIYATDPFGRAAPGQLTFSNPVTCGAPRDCGVDTVVPSPDGRHIAFTARHTSRGDELWVARWNGLATRALVSSTADLHVTSVAWSSSSRLRYIVQTAGGGLSTLREARADGTHDRLVSATGRDATLSTSDSPDHRWMVRETFAPTSRLTVQRKDLRKTWVLEGAQGFAWAPNSRLLAFAAYPEGLGLLDVRTGKRRLLTTDAALALAWSPGGATIAYRHAPSLDGSVLEPLYFTGLGNELKTVTLTGRMRVVVDDDGPFGGALSFAWTRSPGSYRRAEEVDGIYTHSTVTKLAADESEIAFTTCADIGVGSGASFARIDRVACSNSSGLFQAEGLALAGTRTAYTAIRGGNTTEWTIKGGDAGTTTSPSTFASGSNTCCLPQPPVGGSGDLLVYATREIAYPDYRSVHWLIQRAGAGCPCPPLTGFTRPLSEALRLDVDADRILASGHDWVEIFAANGQALLLLDAIPPTATSRFPAAATEAALTGDELLVRVVDDLRIYSATSGVLQRTLPLARASSPLEASEPVLQDAARDRAVYVRDRVVHVVNLVTGTDRVVGAGSLARFFDDGLAYANGARIRIVSWTALP